MRVLESVYMYNDRVNGIYHLKGNADFFFFVAEVLCYEPICL